MSRDQRPAAPGPSNEVPAAPLLAPALAFIALGSFALASALAWQRAFQVDEVETIHAAYDLASRKVVYRDFWQGHHPLLYLLLAPILPFDEPALAFRTARIASLALFGATLLLAGWLARRVGGMAWLAIALLSTHSTFVERGMEVRPDTLMVALVMLALVLGTFERQSPLLRFSLQGLLLGLAFLATQKAAVASLAFGCLWLVHAWRARKPFLVIAPCLVWLVPFAAMLAVLQLQGALDAYVLYNLVHPGESIQGHGSAAVARFSALGPLWVEGRRNPVFAIAAAAALVTVVVLAIRRQQPALWPIAGLAGLWLAGLFVMPFPYPYSHVGGLPALAVTIAGVLPIWLERLAPDRRRRGLASIGAAALLLLPAFATSIPRIAGELARENGPQLRLLERVEALTDESSRVLDLAGLYLREDAYPIYVMTGAHYARYQRGDYPPLAAWLRTHGLDLFVVNYRVKWLAGEDRAFLQTNFVRVEPNIFLSGSDLDRMAAGDAKRFEVTRAGDYRFDGVGELRVDGEPFRAGRLERGVHELSTTTGIEQGRLVSERAPLARPESMTDRDLFYGFD